MLPKINTPIYKLKIPSTNEEIEYRPFLVKEEKVLLTAVEGDDDTTYKRMQDVTHKIIETCTFGKVNAETLTNFDVEYMFLNIRAKSRGETLSAHLPCQNVVDDEICEDVNEIIMQIDDIQVNFPKNNVSKIYLTEEVGIQFKYISAKTALAHDEVKDSVDRMFRIIVDSIDYIFDADSIYKASETPKKELLDFIENLTEDKFDKVKEFFTTQPTLHHTASYVCKKCGNEDEITFEGLESFFDYA